MIQLRYSNDGAENFGPWRDLPSGNTGQFLYPIVARRLGYARHRVWQVRNTGDKRQDILGVSLQMNGSGRWEDFPLPDGTYSDASHPWTQQDVCNYLPTAAEQDGGRSRIKYATAPGLIPYASVGNGPHRGARDVEGRLFVVSGTKLYRVDAQGAPTELGSIPGTRTVSMTHNQVDGGNQLIIATGDNSYVYDTVEQTLTATGVPLVCVDFLNQLILGVDSQRKFWRFSGLADAMSWNSLDNESAESAPDRIVGGIVSQGEWLVFGERTIEVWQNSATDNHVFTRGTVIERGCLSARTICRLDNTVFFVDNNGIPCRLQGYTPVPIAPKSLIDELSNGEPDKLFSFTMEDKGYAVYYLTAQDGRTFGFDVTNQRWHRRESYGLKRWRINTLFKSNNEWFAGDYATGMMYRLQWGHVFEGDNIIPRSFTTGVLHSFENRVFINAFKLLVNTGQPAAYLPDSAPPTISGDVPNGVVDGAISGSYTVVGGLPPYGDITVASGTFPPGLTLATDGSYTGNFTTEGSYSWTVQVTDSAGNVGTYADSCIVGSSEVLPPQLSDWRYKQISRTDATDYSAPDFDDSEWATGAAPFGSWEAGYNSGDVSDGAPTGLNAAPEYDPRFAATFATTWANNTRLWLRRTLTLASIPTGDLLVTCYIEDNCHFYINGDLVITTPADHARGVGQTFTIDTASLIVGDNIIAIRCDDEAPNSAASVTYADFIIDS